MRVSLKPSRYVLSYLKIYIIPFLLLGQSCVKKEDKTKNSLAF